MTASKAERLMNLHIMLLGQRRFIAKQAIRRALYADYPDTRAGDEAFEKAFERDKEDLRAIGSVIEVGTDDVLFDDEPGYRIPPDESSLPELRFEADEAAVLGLAARVWQQATLAKATTDAITKLKAQGVEMDPGRLDVVAPGIRADEPGFDTFWEATQKRRTVTFDYRRGGETTATRRRLQPWGVVRSSGRWYVVGLDVDRGQERVFRLSRVVGPVRATGKVGAYEVPAGTDVREVARRLVPQEPQREVSLLVRQGTGLGLRRQATAVEQDVAGPDRDSAWDRVGLTGSVTHVADEVLTYGANVMVESPPELRDQVVSRLRAVLGEDA